MIIRRRARPCSPYGVMDVVAHAASACGCGGIHVAVVARDDADLDTVTAFRGFDVACKSKLPLEVRRCVQAFQDNDRYPPLDAMIVAWETPVRPER